MSIHTLQHFSPFSLFSHPLLPVAQYFAKMWAAIQHLCPARKEAALDNVQIALNGNFQEAIIFFTRGVKQRTGVTAQQPVPTIRQIPDMAAMNMPATQQINV